MSLDLAVVQARMSFSLGQKIRVCHLCVVTFNLAHPGPVQYDWYMGPYLIPYLLRFVFQIFNMLNM